MAREYNVSDRLKVWTKEFRRRGVSTYQAVCGKHGVVDQANTVQEAARKIGEHVANEHTGQQVEYESK